MLSTKQNNILENKWCVIIPTFNNSKTLKKVIDGVLDLTQKIIVVDDGSTDKTNDILKQFAHKIDIITHNKNLGKGKALRSGFERAIEKGLDYAITIDSDGQHYASDIPILLEEIEKSPESLIIGARNMNQESIPKKSSFGNKFSNFWFWFETGISISDTQTGFRLYPLKKLKGMKFYTNKFEFEIEILVRLSWIETTIKEVPIKVKYDLKERVSHFRPFIDFCRISILNTILVLITLIYKIPLRGLYNLFGKEKIKSIINEFFSQNGSTSQKSLSLAFGLFMGIIPIWGFQMIIATILAYKLKLNKIIVLVASNISIPPLIPPIVFCSYYIGQIFLGGETMTFSKNINIEDMQSVLKQYILGSFLLAIFIAIIAFCISYFTLNLLQKSKIKK